MNVTFGISLVCLALALLCKFLGYAPAANTFTVLFCIFGSVWGVDHE